MMNMSDLELRKMKIQCIDRIKAEHIQTKRVCQRYIAGDVDFPVLLNAVNLAEKEIRKQARTRDVLGLVLEDE